MTSASSAWEAVLVGDVLVGSQYLPPSGERLPWAGDAASHVAKLVEVGCKLGPPAGIVYMQLLDGVAYTYSETAAKGGPGPDAGQTENSKSWKLQQSKPSGAAIASGTYARSPGSLIIIGGGRTPWSAAERLVNLADEAAGGCGAKLVIIPTASPGKCAPQSIDDYTASVSSWWKRVGSVASVAVLHTTDRAEANSEAFVARLRDATGIWMGGGNQWRLADAYGGTLVERCLVDVLERGGVVGGSSAGAAIQCSRMIAGTKDKAVRHGRRATAPWPPAGFDLLPWTAIDQHFGQRNRQARLKEWLREAQEAGEAAASSGFKRFAVGDRVLARWGGGEYYPGIIASGNEQSYPGTYAVSFEDGDYDGACPADNITPPDAADATAIETRTTAAAVDLIGYGIDESTALVVSGDTREVLGEGRVTMLAYTHDENAGCGRTMKEATLWSAKEGGGKYDAAEMMRKLAVAPRPVARYGLLRRMKSSATRILQHGRGWESKED